MGAQAGFICDYVRGVSRDPGLRGDLGGLPTPLVVVSAGSMHSVPNLAQALQEVAVRFLGFFVSFVRIYPSCLCTVILVSYSFFCILLLEEV